MLVQCNMLPPFGFGPPPAPLAAPHIPRQSLPFVAGRCHEVKPRPGSGRSSESRRGRSLVPRLYPPLGRLSPSVLGSAVCPRPPRGVSSLLDCRRVLGPNVSEARGWRPRRRSRGVRGVGLEPAPLPRALIDEPWAGPSALALNPCRRPRPPIAMGGGRPEARQSCCT